MEEKEEERKKEIIRDAEMEKKAREDEGEEETQEADYKKMLGWENRKGWRDEEEKEIKKRCWDGKAE